MSVLKWLLLPFSIIYGLITSFRNYLFDKNILKTYLSNFKTICIGNLQVGGTGKTPFTSYLFNVFRNKKNVVILSRGYGRKTRGLIVADKNSTAETIGDEPFTFFKFLKCKNVIVSEKRKLALKFIEKNHDINSTLVLLDDAFQHRSVKCNVNIILTPFNNLYIDDKMLPLGRLREYYINDHRANIIIVSKCPENLNFEEKINIIQKINPNENQSVFFTTIQYFEPQCLKGTKSFNQNLLKFAFSSIANSENFKEKCLKYNFKVSFKEFPDHYFYNLKEITEIIEKSGNEGIILTTEKDAAKLFKSNIYNKIPENKVYILPIGIKILFNEEKKMEDTLIKLLNQKEIK